jgi:hypothetical protein
MRRKKWLWLGFAALCVFAVAIGWLARPVDELSALRQFQPEIYSTVPWFEDPANPREQVVRYEFTQAPKLIIAKLPLPSGATPDDFRLNSGPQFGRFFQLSDGRRFVFIEYYRPIDKPMTCAVEVYKGTGAWYTQAWLILKHRLGLG